MRAAFLAILNGFSWPSVTRAGEVANVLCIVQLTIGRTCCMCRAVFTRMMATVGRCDDTLLCLLPDLYTETRTEIGPVKATALVNVIRDGKQVRQCGLLVASVSAPLHGRSGACANSGNLGAPP